MNWHLSVQSHTGKQTDIMCLYLYHCSRSLTNELVDIISFLVIQRHSSELCATSEQRNDTEGSAASNPAAAAQRGMVAPIEATVLAGIRLTALGTAVKTHG